jgi:hypothetical protein
MNIGLQFGIQMGLVFRSRLYFVFLLSNNQIFVFDFSRVDPVGISVSPIGYIRGEADEFPTTFKFAKHFQPGGALLTVVS